MEVIALYLGKAFLRAVIHLMIPQLPDFLSNFLHYECYFEYNHFQFTRVLVPFFDLNLVTDQMGLVNKSSNTGSIKSNNILVPKGVNSK